MKYKLYIAVGLVIFIGVAAMGINQLADSGNKAKITTEFAPKGAIATMNGKGIRSTTYSVEPGKYTIEVSFDGFETEKREITVTSGEEQYIGIALESNSEKTENWYEKNENDRQKAEGISSKASDQVNENLSEKFPLFNELPMSWNHNTSSIGTGPSDKIDKGIAVIIQDDSTVGRKSIIEWIKQQGYNPANYEIVFTDYVNPLTSGGSDAEQQYHD